MTHQTLTPALVATTDRRLIRANGRSRRFVLAEITAPVAQQRQQRLPVNLAFILDRSGSMSGEKIALAKETITTALGYLGERDRFSVIAYDDTIDVVVESTPASAEARKNAAARIAAIDARGSTNLSEGWFRGAEQVATHLAQEGVNRCLLMTDGLANKGIVDHDELARHAGELRARGVSVTTFGIGVDFDEMLLQSLADAGGGHFYFVRDAATIRDHLTSEVGETLEVVARDVELEIVSAEDVVVEAITPQATRRRGNRTSVLVGDLVSEQALDVVLRVTFPYGDIGRETGVIVGLADRDEAFRGPDDRTSTDARIQWTYADTAANDTQERDRRVDVAVAKQFAARARQEAVRLNRAGDYEGARRTLEATARRIKSYAGREPELRKLADELMDEAQRFNAPMAPMMLKEAHYASSLASRSRMLSGQAIRRRS
jgi:Ca-activated chloride channel family protein